MRNLTVAALLAAGLLVTCHGHARAADEGVYRVADRVFMKDGTVITGQIVAVRYLRIFITVGEDNKTITMDQVTKYERGGRMITVGAQAEPESQGGGTTGAISPQKPEPKKEPEQPARPKKTGPTLEQVAAAEEAAPKLQAAVIEAVKAGKIKTMSVRIGNRSMKARIVSAAEKGIGVNSRGMEMTVRWKSLSPAEFYKLSLASGAGKDALEAYRIGYGL